MIHRPAKRILIVEDETDIAVLLRYNFEAEGFVVTTAETGEEAEEMEAIERRALARLAIPDPYR